MCVRARVCFGRIIGQTQTFSSSRFLSNMGLYQRQLLPMHVYLKRQCFLNSRGYFFRTVYVYIVFKKENSVSAIALRRFPHVIY